MEQKIASLQHQGNKFQLLKISKNEIPKFQIRINRKVKGTFYNEWQARKMFAMEIQNEVLQLIIY